MTINNTDFLNFLIDNDMNESLDSSRQDTRRTTDVETGTLYAMTKKTVELKDELDVTTLTITNRVSNDNVTILPAYMIDKIPAEDILYYNDKHVTVETRKLKEEWFAYSDYFIENVNTSQMNDGTTVDDFLATLDTDKMLDEDLATDVDTLGELRDLMKQPEMKEDAVVVEDYVTFATTFLNGRFKDKINLFKTLYEINEVITSAQLKLKVKNISGAILKLDALTKGGATQTVRKGVPPSFLSKPSEVIASLQATDYLSNSPNRIQLFPLLALNEGVHVPAMDDYGIIFAYNSNLVAPGMFPQTFASKGVNIDIYVAKQGLNEIDKLVERYFSPTAADVKNGVLKLWIGVYNQKDGLRYSNDSELKQVVGDSFHAALCLSLMGVQTCLSTGCMASYGATAKEDGTPGVTLEIAKTKSLVLPQNVLTYWGYDVTDQEKRIVGSSNIEAAFYRQIKFRQGLISIRAKETKIVPVYTVIYGYDGDTFVLQVNEQIGKTLNEMDLAESIAFLESKKKGIVEMIKDWDMEGVVTMSLSKLLKNVIKGRLMVADTTYMEEAKKDEVIVSVKKVQTKRDKDIRIGNTKFKEDEIATLQGLLKPLDIDILFSVPDDNFNKDDINASKIEEMAKVTNQELRVIVDKFNKETSDKYKGISLGWLKLHVKKDGRKKYKAVPMQVGDI